MNFLDMITSGQGIVVGAVGNIITSKSIGSIGSAISLSGFPMESGKHYFEVVMNNNNYDNCGVVGENGVDINTFNMSSLVPRTKLRVYEPYRGYKINDDSWSNTYVEGDTTRPITVGVMVNMDDGIIGFTKNGVLLDIAFDDLKQYGTVYPFVGVSDVLIKLGRDDFEYNIPDGYSPLLDSQIPPVSPRTSKSATYQLPLNTTQNILSKQNDPREGLLGMANDPDNYGDLYVIGNDGKSHLTKAGIKSEIIFDGSITTVGNYSLSKDIYLFKKLIISYIVSDQYRDTMVINVDEIVMDKTLYQTLGFLNKKAIVRFKDNTTLVDQMHDEKFAITKIIGIY